MGRVSGKVAIITGVAMGLGIAGTAEDMTLDDWRRLMSVNLDGVFLGTKHAICAMKRTGGGDNALAAVERFRFHMFEGLAAAVMAPRSPSAAPISIRAHDQGAGCFG